MKVQRNAIIPSSKGFNLKMKAQVSQFGIFIIRVLGVNVKFKTPRVVLHSFLRLEAYKT
jgi:hypothetical protein